MSVCRCISLVCLKGYVKLSDNSTAYSVSGASTFLLKTGQDGSNANFDPAFAGSSACTLTNPFSTLNSLMDNVSKCP